MSVSGLTPGFGLVLGSAGLFSDTNLYFLTVSNKSDFDILGLKAVLSISSIFISKINSYGFLPSSIFSLTPKTHFSYLFFCFVVHSLLSVVPNFSPIVAVQIAHGFFFLLFLLSIILDSFCITIAPPCKSPPAALAISGWSVDMLYRVKLPPSPLTTQYAPLISPPRNCLQIVSLEDEKG